MTLLSTSRLLSKILIAGLLCCIIGCQREPSFLEVILDKTIKNRYEHFYSPAALDSLTPYETFLGRRLYRHLVSIRAADINWQGLQFRLQLIDDNNDGLFNTQNVDYLGLSLYGQDTVVLNQQAGTMGKLQKRTYFRVDNQYFLLTAIDSLGQHLSIAPADRVNSDALTATFDRRFGEIEIKTIAGDEVQLDTKTDLEHHLLLIWDYHAESQALLQEVSDKAEDWSTHTSVTGLNFVDDPQRLATYLQKQPISFPQYLVSNASCAKIPCGDRPPKGILLDRQGRLVAQGLTAKAMRELLLQPSKLKDRNN